MFRLARSIVPALATRAASSGVRAAQHVPFRAFAANAPSRKATAVGIANAGPPQSSQQEGVEAASNLKKLHDPDEQGNFGRVVAVTSGKGGVGKTTSAASFAMVRVFVPFCPPSFCL